MTRFNRLSRFARFLGTAAVVVGLALLGYVGFVFIEGYRQQQSFHGAKSAATPAATSAAGDPAPGAAPALVEGKAIGEVRISRIGMRAVISQGESDAVLRVGAGHLADTPWPGQPGNVVIAGHRDTVFRPLRNIRAGDVVDITTETTVAHYQVVSTRIVQPTDLSVLKPSDGNTLTLITCYPFSYIGHAPERFVVRATEVR
jgi:sortase A